MTNDKKESAAAKKSKRPSPLPKWSIGMRLICDASWSLRSAAVESSVLALDSSTWPAPLTYLLCQYVVGTEPPPRTQGTIRAKERAALIPQLLTHPGLWKVHLATGARVEGSYSHMALETRARLEGFPAAVYAVQPYEAERTEVLARWVEEVRSLATALNARNGSIFVMPYDAARSEATMIGTLRDFVLQHPYPEQFERMNRAEKYLGDKYVRFPRWGTLLSHEHIAALGGLEKIQQHVQPALVAPCGAGLYFQLTDSVGTAMSAEAFAKQEKFIELAQPLLPPPLLPP